MKNRLICLALCLLMVASVVLTGCSGKTNEDVISDVNSQASESARSMTMWLVSEKEVDAETASRVTKAVNDITESKFKVRMTLYFFTAEEYEAVVTETIRRKEDSKSIFSESGAAEEETTAATEENGTVVDETETDKYGRVTIKYPDLKPNQVDLIYINGEEMFRTYVANGWLRQLDEELSASSKKIKEYVSQTLLSAAKLDGGTYAIPNNNTIGEYTIMLLNKELAEAVGTSGVYEDDIFNGKNQIDGFFNEYIYSYLDNVRALAEKKNDTSIVPVDATYDEMLELLAHYWSIDPDTYAVENSYFSVLGYRYTDPKTLSRGNTILSFNSLLGDETFRKNYYELNRMLKEGGYYGEVTKDNGKTAAVSFVQGSLADYNKYSAEDSEYLPVIVKYPSVDVQDVYQNMFGVCSYSDVELSRCMPILTYLTTNADFRNLLQYGVLGEDYKIVKDVDGDDKVERLQESYMMDIFKTGNAFIAYPEPTMSADVWEIGKQQNRQALIEPLLNFDFAELAKATGATTASTPKVGQSGYTYSWSTGYSREVLSQNALLGAWMDAADRTGKGVYVLHTCASNSGQNLSAMVYYYNNNITNAKVDVSDGNGAVNVSYTGTAGDGYEITVIDFYGKKNSSKLTWNYTFGGSTQAAKIQYQNSLLAFDALNTNTYSISLYQGLTKAMISGNAEVLKWVTSKTGSGAFLGTAVADNTEGGKTYTYLFYLPTLSTAYNVSLMPTGTDKRLELAVNYSADASGKNDNKYGLFLVTIRADEGVTVNLKLNGMSAEPEQEAFATDPQFALCGKLDTELVKYFYNLSRTIEELVSSVVTDSGKTSADLKAMLDDLGVLFTVRSNVEYSDSALQDELADLLTTEEVKALVKDMDLATFYWNLLSATNYTEVHHKEAEVNDDGEYTGKYKDAEKDPAVDESYYYYQSPYAIYYAWLKANGLAK